MIYVLVLTDGEKELSVHIVVTAQNSGLLQVCGDRRRTAGLGASTLEARI